MRVHGYTLKTCTPPLGTLQTVGVTPKVHVAGSAGVHGTVTPHYRIGHFRLLSSERYVNKQGQTVFVRPCFVKGVAETVQDDQCMPQVISA